MKNTTEHIQWRKRFNIKMADIQLILRCQSNNHQIIQIISSCSYQHENTLTIVLKKKLQPSKKLDIYASLSSRKVCHF
jgi:hypothetical protein